MSGSESAILAEEIHRLGLDLPSTALEKLTKYLVELDRWNTKMNLTGLSGPMRIRRLVAEPIWFGRELGLSGRLMDVGSGNGSPAIPLAVTLPITAAILVEPRLRRAAFLRHVIGALDLPQAAASVERARLEDIAPSGRLDWVTFQGVALTATLIGALKRVCSPGTNVLWITSGGASPAAGARLIRIPDGSSEAWVFQPR
jgi:16S rRNA (guanine527-N7)-methyltransferase